MSGLYVHIPFCRRLCGYCDFARTTKLRLMAQVVEEMHTELHREAKFLHDKSLRTIYFGGGTPSLLAPTALQRFIDEARQLFDCSALEEVTVEVNPDDVTEEYAEALRHTDVNRISIGVQSLDDECLAMMGRRHTAAQAVEAVRLLQRAGFANISVDVIFGVAGFGGESLRRTLDGIVAMGVQHISAYHLTFEPATRFGRLLESGAMQQVDEALSEAEFLEVHRTLTAAGFEHYEVSNYALAGCRSRHNSSYWTGDEYLGIGPGAHSFAGAVRRWCEQSAEEYIAGVEYGSEQLTARDRLNEYVMTSLRRVEGLSLEYVAEHFGASEAERLEAAAGRWGATVVVRGGRIAIPPEHFLVSDSVISSLFDS